MMKNAITRTLFLFTLLLSINIPTASPQINTDRVLVIGRNALYFEDYVLAIQYFNQVIRSKPQMAEPYFYRGIAKFYLDDYSGAERDMTLAIERNSFMWMSYQVRGASRHSLNNYEGALQDYNKGLEFRPQDKNLLFNKGIALAQLEDYEAASVALDHVIRYHPKFVNAYLTKGAVYAELKDSVQALEYYNKALDIDKFYAPAYERRAIFYFQQENYQSAIEDIDQAIRLEPDRLGSYINRGLIRYYLNDLRGAMADYDKASQMEPNNNIARFNRGLLRANVGDASGAIEDFDKVLELEPDNFIALYNKVLLNYELGNYANALNGLNQVLDEYPNFLQGYYFRSEIKKEMNDLRGAERDYWEAYDLEKKLTQLKAQGKVITGKAILDADQADNTDDDKTRESSDKDIEKFSRLVVYDKTEEAKSQYDDDIRGRVQDRQVKIEMESQFVVTYYEPVEEIDRTTSRSLKLLTDFNTRNLLKMQLKLTNCELPITDVQAEQHFNSINDYSLLLSKSPDNANLYFARGLDYMVLQDLSEAIDDFSQAIQLDSGYVFAYFNRAAALYKQIEVEQAGQGELERRTLPLASSPTPVLELKNLPTQNIDLKDKSSIYKYSAVIQDYDKVIELAPDFAHAYYNRANIYCLQKNYLLAMEDFDAAIRINPDFAEAYFNRGLTKLYRGETTSGINDLSKAGELGFVKAYSIIKKMTVE